MLWSWGRLPLAGPTEDGERDRNPDVANKLVFQHSERPGCIKDGFDASPALHSVPYACRGENFCLTRRHAGMLTCHKGRSAMAVFICSAPLAERIERQEVWSGNRVDKGRCSEQQDYKYGSPARFGRTFCGGTVPILPGIIWLYRNNLTRYRRSPCPTSARRLCSDRILAWRATVFRYPCENPLSAGFVPRLIANPGCRCSRNSAPCPDRAASPQTTKTRSNGKYRVMNLLFVVKAFSRRVSVVQS
jgi:hypothetical protein